MTYYVYDDPIDLPSGSVRLTPSSPPGLTLGGPRYKILAASDDYSPKHLLTLVTLMARTGARRRLIPSTGG
jgi:hypothetical protein